MSEPGWVGTIRDRHGYDEHGMLDAGIIVYGSLLDPRELWYVFARNQSELIPVNVSGYRRLFNKWVSERLREPRGEDVAGVLNLERADGETFNGVLVPGIPEPGMRKYAHREQEYELTRISADAVEPYKSDDPRTIEPLDGLYTCMLTSGEKLRDDLDPIPTYVEVCLNGAGKWEEPFYRDFINSTWVRGSKLAECDDLLNRRSDG